VYIYCLASPSYVSMSVFDLNFFDCIFSHVIKNGLQRQMF
jgi:hypothetical protein